MERADVVVVGAGIIGLSVAYHLLIRERLRVVVLDRASYVGAGATARATGGIRHQFSTATHIRMTQISMQEFLVLEEEVGADLEFEQTGYLFLTGTPDRLVVLKHSKELQNRLGVPTELLTPDDIGQRFDFVRHDDLVGGTFCAIDGSANPYAAVTGYANAIRSRGGQVRLGQEVQSLDQTERRVRGVRADGEVYSCPFVVNAAGADASSVAAMAGVNVPVTPFRRQVAVLTRGPLGRGSIPFIVDLDTGWYLHRQRDASILLGGTDRDTRPGVDEVVDQRTTERQIEIGLRRMHGLEKASLIRSYVGTRPLTPDDHPILGPTPDCEGLYLACGLGGHGFMHAPAVGMLLAEWILDGKPRNFDTSAVSIERFRQMDTSSESLIF